MRFRLFAPMLCYCHSKTLPLVVSLKSIMVLPFWYYTAQVVLEQRPLSRWLFMDVHLLLVGNFKMDIVEFQ